MSILEGLQNAISGIGFEAGSPEKLAFANALAQWSANQPQTSFLQPFANAATMYAVAKSRGQSDDAQEAKQVAKDAREKYDKSLKQEAAMRRAGAMWNAGPGQIYGDRVGDVTRMLDPEDPSGSLAAVIAGQRAVDKERRARANHARSGARRSGRGGGGGGNGGSSPRAAAREQALAPEPESRRPAFGQWLVDGARPLVGGDAPQENGAVETLADAVAGTPTPRGPAQPFGGGGSAQPGFKPFVHQRPDTDGGQAAQPVQIAGDDDYHRLPSGAAFIGPDGVTRVKP